MTFLLEDGREVLSRTPASLQTLLAGLPKAWTGCDEGPGTWSPYQTVAHLTQVEERDWIDRARQILEHGPLRPIQPVDREGGFSRYEGWSLEVLLDHFAALRASNLEALGTLVSDDDLSRPGSHATLGTVTVGQLLATWVVHDLNHLNQIAKTMAKRYAADVGPWRGLLPILEAI